MATKVYFFRGDQYVRYGSGSNRVEPGYPQLIVEDFPGVAEAGSGFENGFDSVVNWGNGKAYFFLANKYLRYDIIADRVDPGYPCDIVPNWHGTEELLRGSWIGPTALDAVMNWWNGKAYLFAGRKYARYDTAADRVDAGYPLPFAGNWRGLAEAGFTDRMGAAVNWGNGKAYFFDLFHSNTYTRYDVSRDSVDAGYPLPIAGNWPGLAEAGFAAELGVYAATRWGNDREYLFHKNQYVLFDLGTDQVDSGYPLPIGGNWPGMAEAGFGQGIDAAVKWWNGKAYFFRGSQYLRYDIETDKVDSGYPLPIAGNWPGMAEAGFGQGIDAAVRWWNGKVYFFRGSEYLRYDIGTDKVDDGYPLPIADNWPDMAEVGFGQGIDAALNWWNGKVYFFRGTQYLRYDVGTDKADSGYPRPIAGNWPGMAEVGFGQGIHAAVEL